MTKQTKMLVGVGLIGVAAYLIWKSQQPKPTTTSFVGDNSRVFKGDKSFVGDNSKVFKGDK